MTTTVIPRVPHASNVSALIPRIITPTDDLKAGMLKIQAVSRVNNIVAIDGQPGTGKTTCAAAAAVNSGLPYAMVRMSNKPSPLELLRRSYTALTGLDAGPRATRIQLQDDTLHALTDWGGLLIIDELQNAAVNAFQELTWLYEESGKSFSVAVVGTGVINAITNYPQLASRVMSAHTFHILTGEDLFAAVRHLDSRFAETPLSALVTHDQKACGGNLRRWTQTVSWMDALGATGTADDDLLANIRTAMGTLAPPSTVQGRKKGARAWN